MVLNFGQFFTSHIVKVKRMNPVTMEYFLALFTSHIVKVKQRLRVMLERAAWFFTSHIVKVKLKYLCDIESFYKLYIPHS